MLCCTVVTNYHDNSNDKHNKNPTANQNTPKATVFLVFILYFVAFMLLDSYDHMTNQERNALLKTVLHRIEYEKGEDGKIVIDLYPRLPRL